MIIRLFIFIISCFCVSSCYGKEKNNSWVPTKVDKILVIKSKRKMHLIKKDKIVRTYTIALGDNPIGHKMQEGDEKTPEGRYTIIGRNAHSHYYKSLRISYPNKKDIERARKLKVSPGGDIMIHGLPNGIKWIGKLHLIPDWTDGCIAVTNKEMDEIWASVKNGTPIEIRK